METNTNTEDKQQNDAASAENGKIRLLIRTARTQKDITVKDNISIKDLRAKTAELFEVNDPALAVLIFGGKILKDHDNLKTHSIQDGQTVHLVIRTTQPGDISNRSNNSTNQQSQQTNTDSTSNNQQNNDNIPVTGSLVDLQQRLQQMIISNPDTVQRMLDPMIQQLSNNPEMFRSLFGGARQVQQLMEQNPELNHLLSSPEALRDSLEMVRNPAALQEVMRNYDRALNNMESTPGGYNVLRRMYTELQEPLIDAMQEQMGANQFASAATANANARSDDNSTSQESERLRTENRDPLPNPWAANQSPGGRQQNPLGPLADAMPNVSDSNLRSIIDASINAFNSNPELLTQIAGLGAANGGGGGQDGSPNDLRPMFNQMSGIFQNPELMSLMSNPEALQSIAQIQQGLERLQRIAPNLFSRIGLNADPSLNTSSQQTADANSDSTTTGSVQQGNPQQQANFAQMLSQMLGGGGAGVGQQSVGNQQTRMDEATRNLMQMFGGGRMTATAGTDSNVQPPEERYRTQLEQLNEMGFTNREANLRALIETLGDIHLAIARLLQ